LSIWRRVSVALAEFERKLGILMTQQQIDEMKQFIETIKCQLLFTMGEKFATMSWFIFMLFATNDSMR
jgi:hypothetical protein